jgi:hypothetical protein
MDWIPTETMRKSAGVTDERLEKGPRWAHEYIEALEMRLREAREVAESLATSVEPAPGVVEMLDRHNGAVVRFRPGALVRFYVEEETARYATSWTVRLDRHGQDPRALDIASPDGTRLATLSTGGTNSIALFPIGR